MNSFTCECELMSNSISHIKHSTFHQLIVEFWFLFQQKSNSSKIPRFDGIAGGSRRTITLPRTTKTKTAQHLGVGCEAQTSYGHTKELRQLQQGDKKFATTKDALKNKTKLSARENRTMSSVSNIAVDGKETNGEGSFISSSLLRSDTFVYEDSDATPKESVSTSERCRKDPRERSFKRTLSPNYGEPMNKAKRKAAQMCSKKNLANGILLSSSTVCLQKEQISINATREEPNRLVDVAQPDVGQSTDVTDTTFNAEENSIIANHESLFGEFTHSLYIFQSLIGFLQFHFQLRM